MLNDSINTNHDKIESLIPLYNFGFKPIDYIVIAKYWSSVKNWILENKDKLDSILIWIEYLRVSNRIPLNIKNMISDVYNTTKEIGIFNTKWKELKKISNLDPIDPLLSWDYNVS